MISFLLYPFALAFSLLGFSFLFIGIAKLYINKGKQNKITRIVIVLLIIFGILLQIPIGVQKGIKYIENLSTNSSQY
jgi:TM2 domain-containing membrane protein YozV